MKKATFITTLEKYEELRMKAHTAAHRALPDIVINKQGQGILRSDITLAGLDFHAYQQLRL